MALSAPGALRAAEPDPKGIEFFERKIRPVLVEHCYKCHSTGAKSVKGGLLLDSREGVLRGGDSGPAIVPGKADESLLLEALRHEGLEMPPDRKLPAAVIADFTEWVRRGAPDPRNEPARRETAGLDVEAGRAFWSFRPLAEGAVPDVRAAKWPEGAIDRFVLARLESNELAPVNDAGRAELVRRVTFDLIGLPPTPREIDEFVADDSPDAAARLVDRLLASPHFGERWGRHWLDVARFAESSGGGRSMFFPEAWRYRDYVVQSFNDDTPYDRFLAQQIAGDLLPYSTPDERARHLVATGFLVLGPHNYEEQDKAALEMNVIDEQIDTLGRALLGMTLGCARCHDHKFDPVPTRDYYALAGIFRSTAWLEHDNVSRWTEIPLPVDKALDDAIKAHDARVAKLRVEIASVKAALAKNDGESAGSSGAAAAKDDPEARRLKNMEARLKKLEAQAPYRPATMAVDEATDIVDCAIRIRGSVHNEGAKVPRGFLQVATLEPAPKIAANESGRRALAEWLTGSAGHLTARVYVNRAWHHLFGTGLVRTVDNFGQAGEKPSHPELLDYLARDFIRNGWSTKALVRTIVLSHTYRLGFARNAAASARDPENRLLWRANRRRLEAECLRDAMLAASGALDCRMYGSTVDGLKRSQKGGEPSHEYDYVFNDVRRSVYTPVLRNRLPEVFEAFDFSDPNQSVGARDSSTTAPQALVLMNGDIVLRQARLAAARLAAIPDLADDERMDIAYQSVLGRLPTPQERTLVQKALNRHAAAPNSAASWERLYQALFASIEFRYVE